MPRKIVNNEDVCKTYTLKDDILPQIEGSMEREHLVLHFAFQTRDIPMLITDIGNKSPAPFEVNGGRLHGEVYNDAVDDVGGDNEESVKGSEQMIEELVRPIGEKTVSPFDDNDKYVLKKSVNNIMYEFIDANRRGEWPKSTHIYCMWCCHSFDWTPCALPCKYLEGIFYVRGNFCSFNCASAYNFRENHNGIQMWERNSLLNLMYKQIFKQDFVKIKPAPPREVLKIFGGFMTIEEYRASFITNRRDFKIIEPPMISLVPQVEENVVEERYNKKNGEENLRLKRDKPLLGSRNTLSKYLVSA